MKCRLSIFSFDTLKITPHRSGTLCLLVCLGIILSAEFFARFLLDRGFLEQDKSLQKDITANLSIFQNKRPNFWLFGNSTLEFIITDEFHTIAERPTITITHGGATLLGSAALLDYYLRRTPAIPEHIAVFITKDDISAHGLNAETSRHYLEFITWKQHVRWNYSRLRSARRNVYQKIATFWSRLFLKPENRSEWDSRYQALNWGTIDPKKITRHMMKNFHFDPRGFALLAKTCSSHGVATASVVLLPVSTSYAQWHDRLYPLMTYSTIRKRTSALCEQTGLNFIDLAEPLDKKYFDDFFHVNQHGSALMQDRIIDSFQLSIPHKD